MHQYFIHSINTHIETLCINASQCHPISSHQKLHSFLCSSQSYPFADSHMTIAIHLPTYLAGLRRYIPRPILFSVRMVALVMKIMTVLLE